jgi:hypothetical protein
MYGVKRGKGDHMSNYGRTGAYTHRASDSAVARIEGARAGAYAGIGETTADRQQKSAFEQLHLLGFAAARAARNAGVPLTARTGVVRPRPYGWVTGSFSYPAAVDEVLASSRRYGSVLTAEGRVFEVALQRDLETLTDEEAVALSAGRIFNKPVEVAYPFEGHRLEQHAACIGDFVAAHNLRAIMDTKQ